MRQTIQISEGSQESGWDGFYLIEVHYLLRRFVRDGACLETAIEKTRKWFLHHGRGHSHAFGRIGEMGESMAAEMGIGLAGEVDTETPGVSAATDKAA